MPETREKYRGRGVGTALLPALLEELKGLGYQVIKQQETDCLMVKELQSHG